MSKIEERRKLLADEYGIYSNYELYCENQELKQHEDLFISLLGRVKNEPKNCDVLFCRT